MVCGMQVVVSGTKELDKLYYRINVGRPGSVKTESFRDLQKVRLLW